jgi:hypothetical protein
MGIALRERYRQVRKIVSLVFFDWAPKTALATIST